jgi:hypothetical protein
LRLEFGQPMGADVMAQELIQSAIDQFATLTAARLRIEFRVIKLGAGHYLFQVLPEIASDNRDDNNTWIDQAKSVEIETQPRRNTAMPASDLRSMATLFLLRLSGRK